MRRLFLVAMLSMYVGALAAQGSSLEASGAWARPTVEGQRAGGGFVTIKNSGREDDRLLRASSGAAPRMEMHTMSMDANVMRMREVDAIVIKAGQSVALKPGGLHLMFMDLKTPLKSGETVSVVLEFERAGKISVPFRISPRDPFVQAAPVVERQQ